MTSPQPQGEWKRYYNSEGCVASQTWCCSLCGEVLRRRGFAQHLAFEGEVWRHWQAHLVPKRTPSQVRALVSCQHCASAVTTEAVLALPSCGCDPMQAYKLVLHVEPEPNA